MSANSGQGDLWHTPQVEMAREFVQRGGAQSARDAYDQYQDNRSIEGELTTRLYWQELACAQTPSLGLDDLSGAEYARMAMAGGPQCLRMSPEMLGWERREQAFGAGRGASAASGPAVDQVLKSPSMGWSEALDVRTGEAMPAPRDRSAKRLASGISFMSTDGSRLVEDVAAVRRSLDASVSWAPTGAAMSDQAAAMQMSYLAFLDQQRQQHGRALPVGLTPGKALRLDTRR